MGSDFDVKREFSKNCLPEAFVEGRVKEFMAFLYCSGLYRVGGPV